MDFTAMNFPLLLSDLHQIMCIGEATSESCAYLLEELMINILKRLPVKTLLRCMCVCKAWYNLIKNPHFISTHRSYQIVLNQSKPGYLLFIDRPMETGKRYFVHCDNESFDRTLEFVFPEFPASFDLWRAGMCDGIVCFGDNVRLNALLWNLSFRKILRLDVPHTLPLTVFPHQGIQPAIGTVVSATYYLIHGIGFDLLSNDYKFVSVAVPNDDARETKILSVCVYSLKEGAWKHVNSDFVPKGCVGFQGVAYNGVLHWHVRHTSGVSILDVSHSIMTFNLADESFGEMPVPVSIRNNQGYIEFGGVMTVPAGSGTCENIAYQHITHDHFAQTRTINLWVMETYGVEESWRVVVSINENRDTDSCTNIVHLRKNGEILVALKGGRLASLNPSDRSLKVVSENRMEYLGPYMETLVLL